MPFHSRPRALRIPLEVPKIGSNAPNPTLKCKSTPYARAARKGDHRARSAFASAPMTLVKRRASGAPSIFNRAPLQNSIVIADDAELRP